MNPQKKVNEKQSQQQESETAIAVGEQCAYWNTDENYYGYTLAKILDYKGYYYDTGHNYTILNEIDGKIYDVNESKKPIISFDVLKKLPLDNIEINTQEILKGSKLPISFSNLKSKSTTQAVLKTIFSLSSKKSLKISNRTREQIIESIKHHLSEYKPEVTLNQSDSKLELTVITKGNIGNKETNIENTIKTIIEQNFTEQDVHISDYCSKFIDESTILTLTIRIEGSKYRLENSENLIKNSIIRTISNSLRKDYKDIQISSNFENKTIFTEKKVSLEENPESENNKIVPISLKTFIDGIKSEFGNLIDKAKGKLKIISNPDFIPYPGSLVVQSIMFDKDIYTEGQARKWLKDKGYKYDKIDYGDRYYHFQQIAPSFFYKDFRTICFGKDTGIKARVGKLLQKNPPSNELFSVIKDFESVKRYLENYKIKYSANESERKIDDINESINRVNDKLQTLSNTHTYIIPKELIPIFNEALKYESPKDFENAIFTTQGRFAYKRFTKNGIKILESLNIPYLTNEDKFAGRIYLELLNPFGSYQFKDLGTIFYLAHINREQLK